MTPQPHAPAVVNVDDPACAAVIARFTHGARSACLSGPQRTFDEFDAGASVSHGWWLRLQPKPFDGHVDHGWLHLALAANTRRAPDLFAIAMQYLRGAPPRHKHSVRFAGDAHYGRLEGTLDREEGSDFNDYLGIDWTYPDAHVDTAEPRQLGCLDCSGYLRMVWGYRQHAPGAMHLELDRVNNKKPLHGALPRRANEMFTQGPGVPVIELGTTVPTDLSALLPGDLLFFDSEPGKRLDHVGMLLGEDADGRLRFISSRKSANGPTFGDDRGRSVIGTNDAPYAVGLRAARRW